VGRCAAKVLLEDESAIQVEPQFIILDNAHLSDRNTLLTLLVLTFEIFCRLGRSLQLERIHCLLGGWRW
jgi:hypothetical protein